MPYFKTLSMYYCEQAEKYLNSNNRVAAHRYTKNALISDKNCVRASLLMARMEYEEGRYRDAVKVLERIEKQDVNYIPLSIPLLEQSYANMPSAKGLGNYLSKCIGEKPGSTVILAMTAMLERDRGQEYALEFLVDQLHKHPTLKSLAKLIELQQGLGGVGYDNSFNLFRELTKKMLALKPVFACSFCGFKGKDMYWQCPKCRKWGGVLPIKGVEGE